MIKKIGIFGALSELLEPHLFGRTGALKFGAIGVHREGHHIFGVTLTIGLICYPVRAIAKELFLLCSSFELFKKKKRTWCMLL